MSVEAGYTFTVLTVYTLHVIVSCRQDDLRQIQTTKRRKALRQGIQPVESLHWPIKHHEKMLWTNIEPSPVARNKTLYRCMCETLVCNIFCAF